MAVAPLIPIPGSTFYLGALSWSEEKPTFKP